MRDLVAVTTFGPSGWESYAKRGLESMTRFWPGRVIAYYEEEIPADAPDGVEWRPLYETEGLLPVLRWANSNPVLKGQVPKGYSYNFDLFKFCRKVFAQVDAGLQEKCLLYWLDADTRLLAESEVATWAEPLDSVATAYYGRKNFHIESGLVAWDTAHAATPAFLRYYRDLFTNGNILQLKGWHDCWAYMAALHATKTPARDLNQSGSHAPIGDTWFRGLIAHDKGKRKFGAP